MKNLIIDPEFRDKIPPLSADEFSKLEKNIVADGEVREPLVLWNDTIIDGHHRWQIIQKHPDIPYKVKRMEFADKWAAIAWMCKNQLGRRNLTDEQKSYLRGKQYEAEKMTQGTNNQYVQAKRNAENENGQNVHFHNSREIKDGTAGRIGREYGVDEKTIRRDEKYAKSIDEADSISPGFRSQILSGEISAPKTIVSEIRNMPEDKKERVVEAIRNNEKPHELKAIFNEDRYNPMPNATPIVQTEPYNLDDFREELKAIVDNAASCFEQTLVLAHAEMLDTDQGKNVALGVLMLAHNMIHKYENIIKGGANNAGV